MDLKLKEKVILVAAGSKGLGYGIAKSVAQEGAKISIGSRNIKNVEQAISSIEEHSATEPHGFVMDATSSDSINKWIENSMKQFSQIDGLVVNAGGPPSGKFEDFNDADWQSAFELTLMSTVRMIRAVLPHMKKRNKGSIVTITSSSIKEPIDSLLLSNVFRTGVLSVVKSLSKDLAKNGIRINNLIPGRIDTDRVKQLDSINAQRQEESVSNVRAKSESKIPLGRYGTIDEFGNAGAFLLSEASSYITGTSLVVDGGKLQAVV